MEAVDILLRDNRHQYGARVDLSGQRHLDQDSVDLFAPVQRIDKPQQTFCRNRLIRCMLFAQKTEIVRGLYLAAHIDFGRRIVAHQNDSQARRPRMLFETLNAWSQLGKDGVANPLTVENLGHRSQSGEDSPRNRKRYTRAPAASIPMTSADQAGFIRIP